MFPLYIGPAVTSWSARLGCAVTLLVTSGAFAQGPIVADHKITDLSKVPACWVEKAKEQFRLSYGHTSHGSQIVTGMTGLAQSAGSLYWFDHDGTSGGLSLHDYEPSGDLGHNPDVSWAQRTRDLLDSTGSDRNMIMWSWCAGVSDNTEAGINLYLSTMNGLETDYQNVVFVYMTGHLDGTTETGNLNVLNNQIRDYCIANNKVLFDFADIESYDPDGDYFLDLFANDNCDYWIGNVQHNWADEWCAANTDGDLCSNCGSDDCCAHSKPLNCNLKGRAFWWMMARLAGWNGSSMADADYDCDTDLSDLQLFQDCMSGEDGMPTPTSIDSQTCQDVFDFDDDNDVDLADFSAFYAALSAE